MAQKNLFLTLSLFVMVAALIGGILWSRPDDPVVHDSPPSARGAADADDAPDPLATDVGAVNDADAMRRSSVPVSEGSSGAATDDVAPGGAAAADCRIAGVVVDAGGRPIADVQVQANAARGGAASIAFASLAGRTPQIRTTTGADGSFSLAVEAGPHIVTTAASQWMPATRKVEVSVGADVTDLVLTLEPGGTVRGIVLDDVGVPITGARVAPYRNSRVGPAMQVERVNDAEAVTTDAQGRFELGGLEVERQVRLRATADRHASASQQHDAAGGTELVFRLSRHGVVRGVLVDAAGEPIEGTEMTLEGDESPMSRTADARAESDAAGNFEILDVPAGVWTVVARSNAGHSEVRSTPVTVRPGETTPTLRLVAEVGASIEVSVLDADNRPVADAEVAVKRRDPRNEGGPGAMQFTRRVVRSGAGSGDAPTVIGFGDETLAIEQTDAEGRVVIRGLAAGEVELTATHDEHAPSRVTKLVLPRVGRVEAQLTVRAAGVATVRVRDVDGVELADQQVVVVGPAVVGEAPARHTGRTPKVGGIEFGSLLPGAYTAKLARSPVGVDLGTGVSFGFPGEEQPVHDATAVNFEIVAGRETEVVIQAPTLARVRGIVRDARGPVRGVVVRLVSPESSGELPSDLFGMGKSKQTGEDGGFEFDSVVSGDYELRYGREDAVVQHEHPFTIANGQREIELALELVGGEVLVTVLDDGSGQPVRGARVTLERASAGTPGRGAAPRRIAISFGSFSGPGGNESLRMNLGGPGSVETDEQGVARVLDVPRGEYRIKVESDRHAAANVDAVAVAPSQVTRVEPVRLRSAGTLVGTITGFAEDAPVRFAMVEIQSVVAGADGNRPAPRTEISIDGALSVAGIEPGRYSVRARPGPSQEFGPAVEIEIEAGQRTNVELALR